MTLGTNSQRERLEESMAPPCRADGRQEHPGISIHFAEAIKRAASASLDRLLDAIYAKHVGPLALLPLTVDECQLRARLYEVWRKCVLCEALRTGHGDFITENGIQGAFVHLGTPDQRVTKLSDQADPTKAPVEIHHKVPWWTLSGIDPSAGDSFSVESVVLPHPTVGAHAKIDEAASPSALICGRRPAQHGAAGARRGRRGGA